MKDEVKLTIYSADLSTELSLPYADGGIKAGFPSPAQDYLTGRTGIIKFESLFKEMKRGGN